MPVLDFVLNTLGIIENVFSASILALLSYMMVGGWKYVLRSISFFLDTQLVKLIATVFSYFNQLINLDMFNESLFQELTRNIYVFIGVIMFFRLMMLVLKYLINPDLLSDNKAGVNSLVQRVIIGCAGILFIPTIFNIARDFQVAVLKDNLIQKIIIPEDMLVVMDKQVGKGGQYIGTYVLAGFLSPNKSASSSDIKQFNLGVQQGDLSNIDVNDGGFLTQKFKYDYFFLISTLALAYVFYYILKYCIDIAGRSFRLLLYRLIAPIAMIEYMINGSSDGVFKQWLKATLSTYFMLFVRILAIWFVMLIVSLMSPDGANYAGSLLTNNDYFLRAIIIIALLGFMMDLPKLVGQIFGLDLEQEGSASGVLKQVGGMVKGAAIGALAVGGAAAAGGYGVAKGGLTSLKESADKAGGLKNLTKNGLSSLGSSIKNTPQNLKNAVTHPLKTTGNAAAKLNAATSKMKDSAVGTSLSSAGSAILGAALGSNQFTKAAYGGWQNQRDSEKRANDKIEAKKEKEEAKADKIKEREQESAWRQDLMDKQEKIATSLEGGNLKIDPASIATMAGAIAGAMHANSGPGTNSTVAQAAVGSAQGQVAGGTTVTLDNIDVKVNGKATATYDGGLETNITGKATTTYNDGLDVQVAGQANAKYDQGIDVQVNGPATATYDKGIDVQVSGPATAKYDNGIDVQVGGNVSAKYDGDISAVVGGNTVTTVEGGTSTVVVGDTVTTVGGNTEVNLQDVDVKRNGNDRNSNDA